MFTCSKCGGPVSVDGDVVSRACDCGDVAVLASISGHARGRGSCNADTGPAMHSCSGCGLGVILYAGRIFRACSCTADVTMATEAG